MRNIPILCLFATVLCLLFSGCATGKSSGAAFFEARLAAGDTVLYNGNRYSMLGFLKQVRREVGKGSAMVKMHIPESMTETQQKIVVSQFLTSGHQIVLSKPRKVSAISDPEAPVKPGAQ